MTNREAVLCIEDHMDVHKIGQYPHIKIAEALTLAISALRAQEQNEPLTVVPFVITMANGEPVDYKALGKRYRKELLEFDIDGIYVNEDGEMVLMDDCGHCVWLNRDEFAITREPASDTKGAHQ